MFLLGNVTVGYIKLQDTSKELNLYFKLTEERIDSFVLGITGFDCIGTFIVSSS